MTTGFNFGGAIVYDLPWDHPEAYEGRFHEFSATVNPEGIGGYINYAVPPDDTYFSVGDGPWSVGAGMNLGVPGASVSYGSNWYWHIDTFKRKLQEISDQLNGLKTQVDSESEQSTTEP